MNTTKEEEEERKKTNYPERQANRGWDCLRNPRPSRTACRSGLLPSAAAKGRRPVPSPPPAAEGGRPVSSPAPAAEAARLAGAGREIRPAGRNRWASTSWRADLLFRRPKT